MNTAENQIPAKKPLPLPVGNSDWQHIAAYNWCADKTQLISGLLDRDATVALFTRPRRFGKTFAIRMLKTFFEKTEKSNAHLFEGTKVWADPAHRTEQGKIDERRYAAEMETTGIPVLKYGVGFSGKRVALAK